MTDICSTSNMKKDVCKEENEDVGVDEDNRDNEETDTVDDPYVIGIDIGNMYTKAVILYPDTLFMVNVLGNSGEDIIPTCVAYPGSLPKLIGKGAEALMKNNNCTVVSDIKRMIGRENRNPFVGSEASLTLEDGVAPANTTIQADTAIVDFIYELRKCAENMTSEAKEKSQYNTPQYTVLTVPNFFSNSSRVSLMQAAVDAQFQNVHLMNEATAEAFHCCTAGIIGDFQSVFFHFGAASMDCSIVSMEESHMTMRASLSNMNVGGQELTNDLVLHFQQKYLLNSCSRDILAKLKDICEDMKKELATSIYYTSSLAELDLDTSLTVTRTEFEEICMGRFQSVELLVQQVLETADVTFTDISRVVLTGGSCEIPIVRAMFARMFPNSRIIKINDPSIAAKGAALYANSLYYGQSAIRITDIKQQRVYLTDEINVVEVIPFQSRVPARNFQSLDLMQNQSVFFYIDEQHPSVGERNRSTGTFHLTSVNANTSELTVICKVDSNGILEGVYQDKP